MTIKSGTFSSLNVKSVDAGKSSKNSKTSSDETASRESPSRVTSSRSRRANVASVDSLLSLAPGSITADSLSYALSNAIQSATSVYSYSSTVYDTEITGSGIASVYPVVLGVLPLTNLYTGGGKKTNLGEVFDIQNDLKDQTIALSDSIVSQYYELNPSAESELSSIRSSNNSKIQNFMQNIPGIVASRQKIIDSTNITSRSEDEQRSVDVAAATTGADAAKAIGLEDVPESSPEEGTFKNRLTDYIDDDVTKYDDGSSIVTKLERRLLGTDKYTRNEQAKTARQYQLLKAALFQVTEGKRLNDVEEYGLKSPYEDLQYYAISNLSDYKYDERDVKIDPTFTFAKATIHYAALMMGNDFKGDGSRYLDEAGLGIDLENFGIAHGGVYSADSGAPLGSVVTRLKSYYYGEPTVAIKQSRVDAEFITQAFVALASEIMEESNYFSYSSMPNSLNPLDTSALIPVQDTISDSPRLIAETGGEKRVALFDASLQGAVGDDASPVSDAILLGNSFLQKILSETEAIKSDLLTFAKDNKAIMSNQCALTLMSIFYGKIINFLNSSVIGTDSNTDWSATRAAMYFLAAHDDYAAARLYRIIESLRSFYDEESEKSKADGKAVINGAFAYGSALVGPLVTDDREEDVDGVIRSVSLGSRSSFSKTQKKFEIDITASDPSDLLDNLLSTGGSFNYIFDVSSEIAGIYPAVGTSTILKNKIKISFFTIFLYFLRKIPIKVELTYEKDDYRFRGFLKWFRSDSSFLSDCLTECFTTTQVSDLAFENFSSATGAAPSTSEQDAGENIYKNVRTTVKGVLQAYQDVKSLIAYQRTVIGTQYNAITQLFQYYENLADVYNGDSEKAASIAARYASIESVVELMYRVNRYQTLIPNTLISSISTRSNNYRSIVKSTFKDLIPVGSNLRVCIVGIPYGHLELLRLAQDDRKYYFGVKVNADDVRSTVDEENEISYQFRYLTQSESIRPELGGPYNVYIPEIKDDFNSSTISESVTDSAISLLVSDSEFKGFSTITRDSATDSFKSIDFPAALVQAALQSYIEDVYGIYPRYSSTKSATRSTPYPEEQYADLALQRLGYTFDTQDPDKALLYARLRATIMMHRDFLTTKLVEDIEASPVFDKIVYILFRGEDTGNIITEIYAKVEV